MTKTETNGVYVFERSRAIEKILEWNKDKKNLSILSAVPFQKDDKGWEVTYSYEEAWIKDCYCGSPNSTVVDDSYEHNNSTVYFVKCETCHNRQREKYFSRDLAIAEWNKMRDYYSEDISSDMVVTYKDGSGTTHKRHYRVIMDFMDEVETISGAQRMRYCYDFDAKFFGNSLNTKQTNTLEELYRHCKTMVS